MNETAAGQRRRLGMDGCTVTFIAKNEDVEREVWNAKSV